jgi:superfamily II DNA/RNA helicase
MKIFINKLKRGLDIPNVTRVILYDMPDTIEDFIHRSGTLMLHSKGFILLLKRSNWKIG